MTHAKALVFMVGKYPLDVAVHCTAMVSGVSRSEMLATWRAAIISGEWCVEDDGVSVPKEIALAEFDRQYGQEMKPQ